MTTVDHGPEISERVAAFMHERTVAFWGHLDSHNHGEPTQYGSGVLLQIDDMKFILTAEHVTENFMKHGVSLFLGGASDKLFPITQTYLRQSKKDFGPSRAERSWEWRRKNSPASSKWAWPRSSSNRRARRERRSMRRHDPAAVLPGT
jgi:hypothetical protein